LDSLILSEYNSDNPKHLKFFNQRKAIMNNSIPIKRFNRDASVTVVFTACSNEAEDLALLKSAKLQDGLIYTGNGKFFINGQEIKSDLSRLF
jgi:hypothetical protein